MLQRRGSSWLPFFDVLPRQMKAAALRRPLLVLHPRASARMFAAFWYREFFYSLRREGIEICFFAPVSSMRVRRRSASRFSPLPPATYRRVMLARQPVRYSSRSADREPDRKSDDAVFMSIIQCDGACGARMPLPVRRRHHARLIFICRGGLRRARRHLLSIGDFDVREMPFNAPVKCLLLQQ